MSESLPTQTISIPSAQDEQNQRDAKKIVEMFRDVGIDPKLASNNPACISIIRAWLGDDMSASEFRRCAANILIFAPSLKR